MDTPARFPSSTLAVGAAAMLAFSACAAPASEPGAATDEPTTSPATPIEETPTPTAELPPTEPPATPTSAAAQSPTAGSGDGGAEPAAGSGTVTIDDTTYDVSVLACGWVAGSPDVMLAEEPGTTNDFRLIGTGAEGSELLFVELRRDADVGVVEATAAVQPAAQAQPTLYQPSSLIRPRLSTVELSDGRVRTAAPLPVETERAGSPITLDVDLNCESFGGSLVDAAVRLAELRGVDFTRPTPSSGGHGTLFLDGVQYEVVVEQCTPGPTGTEVIASGEGIDFSLIAHEDLPTVFVEIDGQRRISDPLTTKIVVDGDTYTSSEPVQLMDQMTSDSAGEVTFQVSCAA